MSRYVESGYWAIGYAEGDSVSASVPISGIDLTSSYGSINLFVNDQIIVGGVYSTASIATLTAIGVQNSFFALSGQQVNTNQGSITAVGTQNALYSVSGISLSGSIGSVSGIGQYNGIANVSGIAISIAIGTIATATTRIANISVEGISANALHGSVIAKIPSLEQSNGYISRKRRTNAYIPNKYLNASFDASVKVNGIIAESSIKKITAFGVVSAKINIVSLEISSNFKGVNSKVIINPTDEEIIYLMVA